MNEGFDGAGRLERGNGSSPKKTSEERAQRRERRATGGRVGRPNDTGKVEIQVVVDVGKSVLGKGRVGLGHRGPLQEIKSLGKGKTNCRS